MIVTVYTDGACAVTERLGGWAACILVQDGKQAGSDFLSAGCKDTTNNAMELTAVVAALDFIKENYTGKKEIEIRSDSAYIVNSVSQKWYVFWRRQGWKTKAGEPVKNVDLWKRLIRHVERGNVVFTKVKGHSGDEYNDIVDAEAKKRVTELRTRLC